MINLIILYRTQETILLFSKTGNSVAVRHSHSPGCQWIVRTCDIDAPSSRKGNLSVILVFESFIIHSILQIVFQLNYLRVSNFDAFENVLIILMSLVK